MTGINPRLALLLAALLVGVLQTVRGQYMELTDKRIGNNTYKMNVIRDYGDKTLKRVRYLKFPRVGVTFAATVLR
jgi:hypothetical protein